MSSSIEAENYLSALNRRVSKLGLGLDKIFLAEGCTSYVKTIYIGYDIDGVMVAALYGRADHIELALALDENHDSEFLVDAAHLTWRTLPVAAIVRNEGEIKQVAPLIREACERIRGGDHDVLRDNEFFMKSRRERRGR